MAQPSRTTVTIDGNSFNAIATDLVLSTESAHSGMPMMGSIQCAIDVRVDANDQVNLPFSTLRSLYDLANIATRDKIKDIKIDFWTDDTKSDVICSYAFQGWISRFHMSSSGEANHTLALSLEPTIQKDQYHKIDISN